MRIATRARALEVAVAAITCLGVAATVADSAGAYTHGWSCYSYAASQCYDDAYTRGGTQYNPWVYVHGYTAATSDTLCAKGITAAGNLRTPQACAYNVHDVAACFAGSGTGYPESWAYVYWNGSGTQRHIDGDANTVVC